MELPLFRLDALYVNGGFWLVAFSCYGHSHYLHLHFYPPIFPLSYPTTFTNNIPTLEEYYGALFSNFPITRLRVRSQESNSKKSTGTDANGRTLLRLDMLQTCTKNTFTGDAWSSLYMPSPAVRTPHVFSYKPSKDKEGINNL